MKTLDFDWKPLALVPLLAMLVFPLIGSSSTWLTLTVAGLAHSIKNILAGLEGGIYVVNSGMQRDNVERVKGGWSLVQRYVEQVGALVQNLLSYVRPEGRPREAVPPQELEKIIARIPVGRLGRAEDIARSVAFLVAEEAGFITGATLSVNGGQHMY